MKLTSQKILNTGLAVIIGSILFIVFISYQQAKKIQDTALQVSHTNKVLYHSESLMALTSDNVAKARGYALTGSANFLAHFQEAQKTIYLELAELKMLTIDKIEQQQRLDSLTDYIDKRIEFSNRIIAARQEKGLAAATALSATEEGLHYMNWIRELVYRLQADEKIFLDQRTTINEQAVTRMNRMLLILAVTVLVLFMILILAGRKIFQAQKRLQKQLEQANANLDKNVKKKTRELTDVFERITDAFVALDKNWCYTYMNKKAGEIFNRDPEKMIGRHIWTEFPEGIGQSFYTAYYRAMAEQQYIHIEEYYPPYDKWFENHIYPSPEGLSVFFRDVTEKKKTEDKLAQNEKRFRALVENNEGVISLVDEKLNVLFRSSSAARITGWANEEFEKTNAAEYIHPDDLEGLKSTMAKAMENAGENIPLEIRVRHKNGNYIWMEGVIKNMIHDPAIGGIITNMRDITERKNAEEKLKASEEQYRDLVENITDLICTHDLDGRILSMNRKAEEVIGQKFDPKANLNIKDILTPGTKKMYEGYITGLQKIGHIKSLMKVQTRHRGIRIWEFNNSLKITEGKEPVVRGYARDITEQKNAEDNLIEKEMQLRLFIENSPAALAMFDNDMKYIIASNRFITDYKIGDRQITGKSHYEVFPELTQRWKDIHQRCLAGAIEKNEEEPFIRSDGSIDWVRWEIHPWYKTPGEIGGIILFSEVITERKKAEESLKEAHQRLSHHLYNTPLAVIEWDKNLIIRSWSPQAEIIFGWKEAEVVNKHFNDFNLVFEEDAGAVSIHASELMSGAVDQINNINRNNTKSGKVIYCQWFNSVMKDEQGNIQSILSLIQDITESKKAEEEIQKLATIVQRSPEFIGIASLDAKAVYLNEGGKKIVGLDRDITTTSMWDYFAPQDLELFQNKVIPIVQKEGRWAGDINLRNFKTKELIPVWMDIFYIFHPETNEPLAFATVTTDITERKKAETERKKSVERFEMIALATNDGLWEWNFETGELWANKMHQHLYELAQTDPVPGFEQWKEKIHPDDRERIIADRHEALASDKKVWISEYRFNTNVKGYIDIYDRTYIVRNEAGKAIHIIGSMMDVTERKKAEKDLVRSKNQLRTILQTEPECVKQLNQKGEVIDMNPAGLAMIEADDLETVKGKSVLGIIGEPYREAFSGLTKKVFNGESGILAFEVTGLKGTSRWLETHAVPLKNTEGEIVSLLGVTRDITEQKKAEEKIIQSNERFELVGLATNDALWEWNLETNKVWGNEIHQNLYGLTMDDPVPDYDEFKKRLHPEDRDRMLKTVEEMLASNRKSFVDEYRFFSETKEWIHIYGSTFIERNKEGKPIRLVGSMLDITERKKTEEQIKSTNEQLRQLTGHLQTIREEERSRIGQEIHDQLGQYLTVLKMDVSRLKKNIPAGKNKDQDLVEILSELDNCLQVVRKISADLRPSIIEDLGLIAALEWQSEDFERRTEITTKFYSNVSEIKLPQAYSIGLFRIFQESLTNVAKHAEAREVIAELINENGFLIMTISDNGKGFNTDSVGGKKSLGLLGMRERTLLMNGQYEINSRPGEGTVVKVSVPL